MTNEERRVALAKARRKAMEYADAADKVYDKLAEDGPEAQLANMWANVASAMKVGHSLEADGVIPDPADIATDGLGYPIITR